MMMHGVSIISVSHDGTHTIALNPEIGGKVGRNGESGFDLPSYNEAAANPSNELPPDYKIVENVKTPEANEIHILAEFYLL